MMRATALAATLLLASCAPKPTLELAGFTRSTFDERVRVLDLYPGVTATIVAPARVDPGKRVDLILYALPNGNTTLETMGRRLTDSISWRYDIQHIAAQTRALRERGLPQAIVVYLEADSKSWPHWRSSRGYDKANRRIVEIVDQIRYAVGNPPNLALTLTGHSGGGSFAWGFIDGQDSLPPWLERIAFLDSNYSFEWRHGEKLVKWLRRDPRNTLVVLAYDDRNITIDGKKIIDENGGTWRASGRMMNYLREPFHFQTDTLGEFTRFRAPQIDVLLHPNRDNRILHTVMIGEMNGYMHALLARRPDYERSRWVLEPARVYTAFVGDDVTLPPPVPPEIPARARNAMTGSAFIASLANLSREEREAAIKRELFAGNMPPFLRRLRTVKADSVEFDVMPDYLAIGSAEDYVRMPMLPYTAQAFCDAFGFVLPTSRMVDQVWMASEVKLEPRPLTQEREAPATFLQHHRIIAAQLEGSARGAFVAGIKKDIVVTDKLLEKPNRVAIYGWHYQNGKPIQPVYTGHVDWYVDYSHGIRPVRRMIRVNGVEQPYEKVLHLLSDAPQQVWRYDWTP